MTSETVAEAAFRSIVGVLRKVKEGSDRFWQLNGMIAALGWVLEHKAEAEYMELLLREVRKSAKNPETD